MCFRSESEVKIAAALDRAGVLFFPNSNARLTAPAGRQNLKPDFLICSDGKWGILQVERLDEESNRETKAEDIGLFQACGIPVVRYYEATRCLEEPDKVVREFLDVLQSPI